MIHQLMISVIRIYQMVIIEIIHGDLLNSGEKYIAQQCNCVTIRGLGLSHSIAQKYPYANVYAKRIPISKGRNRAKISSQPGTIEVCMPPNNEGPIVICMYAQYSPGKVKTREDSTVNRLQWFEQCLKEIEKLGITRVAMPYLIGCGLAGGNWKDYSEKLNQSKLEVVLYQL